MCVYVTDVTHHGEEAPEQMRHKQHQEDRLEYPEHFLEDDESLLLLELVELILRRRGRLVGIRLSEY